MSVTEVLASLDLPAFAGPGALAVCVAAILATGKAPYVLGFRLCFVNRRVDPVWYWWSTLCWAGFAMAAAWPLLKRTALGAWPGAAAVADAAELIYPVGGPVLVVAYLIGGAFAERRRRAYMRRTYPSALHRASGGG